MHPSTLEHAVKTNVTPTIGAIINSKERNVKKSSNLSERQFYFQSGCESHFSLSSGLWKCMAGSRGNRSQTLFQTADHLSGQMAEPVHRERISRVEVPGLPLIFLSSLHWRPARPGLENTPEISTE